MSVQPKHVLILGLDTFAAKNVVQLEAMAADGYHFDVATLDSACQSAAVFARVQTDGHRLIVLKRSLLPRWRQVATLLRTTRYHHVELYPAGRFGLAYVWLLERSRQTWCVVERGDVGYLSRYSRLTQASLRAAYRRAHAVWYKEPYMPPLLRAFGARNLMFVPNAAQPGRRPPDEGRNVEFLWVNRLTAERRPTWVVDALATSGLAGARAAMLGFLPEHQCDLETLAHQRYVCEHRPPNLVVEGYVDPRTWYPRARFFVLPGTRIFGNNSLLEAMAHGVVPIVTESEGIRELVEHGRNGLLVPLESGAFREAMVEAMRLTPTAWRRLSDGARQTTEGEYGIERWRARVRAFYTALE